VNPMTQKLLNLVQEWENVGKYSMISTCLMMSGSTYYYLLHNISAQDEIIFSNFLIVFVSWSQTLQVSLVLYVPKLKKCGVASG
jgi:hypothetical protein